MAEVIALGEALVEIMRPGVDLPLGEPGVFLGPYPSGAPAIFADAVGRLGVSCGFIGAVGADPFGDGLIERLRRDGVDVQHIRRVDTAATGVAFVAYRRDGSRQFVFHIAGAAAGQMSPEQVVPEYIQGARWLHITGSSLSVNEPMRQACYRAVELAAEAGLQISFDPNLRAELIGVDALRAMVAPVLDRATVVLPSGEEARLLTGLDDDEAACEALIERGVRLVALKQGAQGCTIYSSDGKVHVPGFRVLEVDPTGAGDCFAAGLAVGILSGWELPKVARFANAVGALAVTKQGPMEGAPTRREVELLMRQQPWTEASAR
ncbi:MAG: sugar kinase [Anaerolineae bacterium]